MCDVVCCFVLNVNRWLLVVGDSCVVFGCLSFVLCSLYVSLVSCVISSLFVAIRYVVICLGFAEVLSFVVPVFGYCLLFFVFVFVVRCLSCADCC